ncbi:MULTISPECIES: DUF2281 domain-containing protein [Spirulina sp. CCY15215]|uniref:DUF2281 domain-containing protein n=1 Tax=Spirulina sp. CCY15215 TaxID=2767591 RepID=UPI00194E7CEF|nr:DUF2281 domain-containing protein [Spirulina major]
MNVKERIMQEIEQTPEFLVEEVLDFLQFLKNKYQQDKRGVTLLSEASLSRDWLKPEEDEAWQNL